VSERVLCKVPLDPEGYEQVVALQSGRTLRLRRVRVLADNRAVVAGEVSVPISPCVATFLRDLARLLGLLLMLPEEEGGAGP